MFITEYTPGWINVDNKLNALDSLAKAGDFLKDVNQDKGNWKWFVIALHHALYTLMLLALENTDGSGVRVRDERDDNGYIITANPDTGVPVPLITFLTAYERLKDSGRMRGYTDSAPFVATEVNDKAMRRINFGLRNKFMHMEPTGWGIEVNYIVFCCLDLEEVIKFFSETSQILWVEDQKEQLIHAQQRIIQRLIELATQ